VKLSFDIAWTGFSAWSYVLLFALLVLFPLMAAQNAHVRNVELIPRFSIYISSCAVLWALFAAAMLVLQVEKTKLSSLGVHWHFDAVATSAWLQYRPFSRACCR